MLARGADVNARATIDAEGFGGYTPPRWHEARDVTAADWGRGFPEPGWVNAAALRLIG